MLSFHPQSARSYEMIKQSVRLNLDVKQVANDMDS